MGIFVTFIFFPPAPIYYHGNLKIQFLVRNHCPTIIMTSWLKKIRAKMRLSVNLSFPNHLPPVPLDRSSMGEKTKKRPTKAGITIPPNVAEWLNISWTPTKYQGAFAGLGGCRGSARSERGEPTNKDSEKRKDSVRN